MTTNKNEYSFVHTFLVIEGPKTNQIKPRPREYFPFSKAEYGIWKLLIERFPTIEIVRNYFRTLLYFDIFTIAGGSFTEPEEEKKDGLTRVMYRRSKNIVYFDFYISEALWESQDMEMFKHFYASHIKEALYESVRRMKKYPGEVIDEKGFLDICDEVISIFLKNEYELDLTV